MRISYRDLIENTYESFFYRYKSKSKLLYLTIISFVIITLLLMPFIKIDVSIKTNGIIESSRGKTQFKSQEQGLIVFKDLFENKKVSKNDTLLILKSEELEIEVNDLKRKALKLNIEISDLSNLISHSFYQIKSEEIKSRFSLYQSEKKLLKSKIEIARRDFENNKKLFEKKVIPENEFTRIKYNLNEEVKNLNRFEFAKKSEWTALKTKSTEELEIISNKLKILEEKKNNLVFCSPDSGYVINVLSKGLSEKVFTNEALFEFIYDDSLYAYLIIPTDKIGLIKPKMNVVLSIDTFDNSYWGNINSQIIEISKTPIKQGNKYFFKAKCILEKTSLQLKNGTRGEIQRGMTLTANLLLNKRSLWNLLSDDINDFLNPKSSYYEN